MIAVFAVALICAFALSLLVLNDLMDVSAGLSSLSGGLGEINSQMPFLFAVMVLGGMVAFSISIVIVIFLHEK